MLRADSFSPTPALLPFHFEQLKLLPNSPETYADGHGDQYAFTQYDSVEEVHIADQLARQGVLLNYKGTLTRDGKYYVFYSVGEFMQMQAYAEGLVASNERVDERFCHEYFEAMTGILSKVQKQGQYLKFINPASIGLRNQQSDTNTGFGLLLPFSCKFFNCILRSEYQQNIRFVAPEVIRYFEGNPNQQVCPKQLRKASLYSVGLNLLMCFGYVFTARQRIEASRNDKQFRSSFKKIRKQIKVLHGGKYVPKALKLLLQDCEKSRQLVETFMIKIHSAQFQSLKVYKPTNPNDYKYYSTVSDCQKTEMNKSQRTINIEINSNSSPITFTPTPNINISSSKNTVDGVPLCDGSKTQSFSKPALNEQDNEEQIVERDQESAQQHLPYFAESSDIAIRLNEQGQHRRAEDQYEGETQIYRYNDDRLSLGPRDNKSAAPAYDQNMLSLEIENPGRQLSEARKAQRQRFQSEARLLMGAILLGFFLYGLIGYLSEL